MSGLHRFEKGKIFLLGVVTALLILSVWHFSQNGAQARNEPIKAFRTSEEQRVIDVYKQVNNAVALLLDFAASTMACLNAGIISGLILRFIKERSW